MSKLYGSPSISLTSAAEQWRGFKGLVYLQGLGGVTSRNSQIDYIDFGHLTKGE